MSFTSETKYGYKDGDHIANWGTQFPVFVRVQNGKIRAVAREDRPDHPTPGRFGNMFMCSREWLKATVFAANKSYADLFEDSPNNVQDSSEPGSNFIKASNVEGLIKAPVIENTTTTSTTLPTNTGTTTSTPATGTTTTATTTTTSTNPLMQAFQSATGQTGGSSSKSMLQIIGITVSIIFMLGGLYFLFRSRK